MMIPDFPNLFCLYGPGSNLIHGGSIIFMAECQVGYVMGCLRTLVEDNVNAIEVTSEAYSSYVDRFRSSASRMVAAHPSVNNWFKNGKGDIITNWPWTMLDMWRWTQAPDLKDFSLL
jgi:4-hydroxyacetophenone monooxygenase